MLLATLLFAAALQQCSPYTGPNDGAIHVCGHAYKLTCTRFGSPTDCEGNAHGHAEVDHFEVRDERGGVVFERNVSADQILTDVGISETGYPDHPQLFAVSVERQTNADGNAPSISYVYYFHATSSGLIAFQPAALSCAEGTQTMLANLNVWPPGGMVVGCKFLAGYFRFTVELEFEWDRHQIVAVQTGDSAFHVGGSTGNSTKAAAVSTLHVCQDHDKNAPQFTIRIARGQVTRLLAAWVPIVLRTTGDVGIVSYDPDKLWLQIELKNQRGWIRGDAGFRAIGLHHAAGAS